MASSRPARSLSSVVVLGAVALLAAGCTAVGPGASSSSPAAAPSATPAPAASGSGSASGQSKAAACQILGSSLEDLSSSLQTAYSKYASDPKAAVADLQKVTATFQASVQKVTEPGAASVATTAQTDLKTLIADVQDAVNHPLTGAAKVQKLLPTIQADFQKIGTYCS